MNGKGVRGDTIYIYSLQLQLVVCLPWLLQRGQHPWPVLAVAAGAAAVGEAVREGETQRRMQRSHLWLRQAAREKAGTCINYTCVIRQFDASAHT